MSVGRPPRALLWLTPLAMLLAVGVGLRLALSPPDGLVALVLGGALVVLVGWIVVSVLWPARAERTCPACRHDELERLDPDATIGIRCRACGFVDRTASAWFLAEDEGEPLEDVVLEERGRHKRARSVDSGGDEA